MKKISSPARTIIAACALVLSLPSQAARSQTTSIVAVSRAAPLPREVVDAEALLPPDDTDLGFDNMADILSVSPALPDRYMSSARKVSRIAVGDPSTALVPLFNTSWIMAPGWT